MSRIANVHARQILDSRGNPTETALNKRVTYDVEHCSPYANTAYTQTNGYASAVKTISELTPR